MKKTHLLVMALFAIFSFSSCSETAMDEIETQMPQSQTARVAHDEESAVDVDADSQWKANEYLQKINDHFSSTPIGPNNDASPYPGYYGGAYINDEGRLVVYLKGNADKHKQKIFDIIGSNDIVVKSCKHSYKTLVKVMDDLNAFKHNKGNSAAARNFNVWALSDSDNEILVELDEYNENKIKEFKKMVMNSPAIRFKKSSGPVELEATLNPGCFAETNAEGTRYSSFGFRAKRNSDGVLGMVMAGHSISVNGTLYYNGASIGTCLASYRSGSADAAFVKINNTASYTPSNTICGTSTTLSTATSLPGVGTLVNFRGAVVGSSTGKILNTNVSITTKSGYTYTNLTSANYTSYEGDSGGIIYTYVSSTGTRYTVGIHTASDGATRYFTKAPEALKRLGVSRY